MVMTGEWFIMTLLAPHISVIELFMAGGSNRWSMDVHGFKVTADGSWASQSAPNASGWYPLVI